MHDDHWVWVRMRMKKIKMHEFSTAYTVSILPRTQFYWLSVSSGVAWHSAVTARELTMRVWSVGRWVATTYYITADTTAGSTSSTHN